MKTAESNPQHWFLLAAERIERGAPPMKPENVTRMLENWALSWLLIDPFVAG